MEAAQHVPGIQAVPCWDKYTLLMMVVRWIDSLCGYGFIALFAFVRFECFVCVEWEYRQFGANHDDLVDLLCMIGACAWTLDVLLYFILACKKIAVSVADLEVAATAAAAAAVAAE